MIRKAAVYPLVALVMLGLAMLACGSDNTGTKVGTTSPGSSTPSAKVQTYAVGDVVQAQDHTIVLNTANIQGSILKANFTIENKGSKDLNVSSLLSFTAKDSEGSKLEMEIMDCGPSSLDGTVLPGDKLKGTVCWSGATTKPVKIYYAANFLGSGAIVWEIK